MSDEHSTDKAIPVEAERLRADTRARLNAETGRMSWPELERHFARGAVIKVVPGMDLVDVAVALSEDDKTSVEKWMAAAKVAHPNMDDAKGWVDRQPEFWAVVVAPWVLIQEIIAPER